MASDPKKNPAPGTTDRAQMMRVLVPAGAVALIVILVAVIAGMTGGGRAMSDGSDGSADDPELKQLSPGVKYRDLKEGDGESCPPGVKVKAKYAGWLADGTEFDNSKDGSIEFDLKAVIPGWQAGIPGMKVGGVRKLVISPDLGYGNRPQGKIPPGSTLIFEVELVGFDRPANLTDGPGKPMSDGSNGGTNDPDLRAVTGDLKVRDLKEGSGVPCPRGASVTVNYAGWLVDGTPFDSGRGVSFSLSGVVMGWVEGIPGMKPGGIRKLVVPAAFGYGTTGKGSVPPNATMIFEVELVRVE